MDKLNLLILGGTGSLGRALLKHLVADYTVSVFSRDEAKHVKVKALYPQVKSLIGDIRDRDAVFNAITTSAPDIIINASALKNVPEVEEVPIEGIKTSLLGAENLASAAKLYGMLTNRKMKVLTVSTDKACKPVNAYGMSKALQERLHVRYNSPQMVCNSVRYGNVLESRGSLIPILKQRLSNNQSVYITHKDMTRFFLTLDDSVELIKRALQDDEGGKIFVPIIRSAKIVDVVNIFCEIYGRDLNTVGFSRIRPGEKLDEIMVSKEEAARTQVSDGVFIIHDILTDKVFHDVSDEYSSGSPDVLLSKEEFLEYLKSEGVVDAGRI